MDDMDFVSIDSSVVDEPESDPSYSDDEMEQDVEVPVASNICPRRQAAIQAIKRMKEQIVEEFLSDDDGYFQDRKQQLGHCTALILEKFLDGNCAGDRLKIQWLKF